MRLLIQRVSQASCDVEGSVVGDIGPGLLVFLGIGKEDTPKDLDWCIQKLLGLRLFQDDNGKMSLDIREKDGGILVISQFTLYGNCKKGRRPSFDTAMAPGAAEAMYEMFLSRLQSHYPKVESGQFGAHMSISLVNDGPVTLFVESP